ncbi:hypothetical protein HPB47_012851 [Ixodes persulcatus]|uniref:Uncharacterized protein n=1 Tax=Ixodes persulcatus TaxID=34615 RepID=A0AC60NSA5_IXOPE|nr:hypothetical protein HPB47_012851 [Ixodes persulcatus]
MANRYTKELGRTRWRTHCESFNQRTGLGKAWHTYRGIDGRKRRTRNAAQNLALKLNISEEELAIKAVLLSTGSVPSSSADPVQLVREDAASVFKTCRQLILLVNGLLNFTPLKELRQEAQMSRIEDRANVQNIAQFQRLERTRQGRRLLEDLGHEAVDPEEQAGTRQAGEEGLPQGAPTATRRRDTSRLQPMGCRPGQRNADNALPDAKKRRHDSTSDDATDDCHFQASWSARDPDSDDEGTWNMATARRGRAKQRPDAMKERRGLDQYVLSFRPKGRRAMADIPLRELHQQITALAVAPETIKHLTVRVDDVSNTITITTYDRLHATRLRQHKELRVPGQPPLEVTIHQVPSRGMSREVIRTLQTETEDTLKEALESESATILAARPMGKSLMALITFAAPRPPRTIKYWSRLTAVSLYVPRTLVCFRCHGMGHKQDICTKPVCERCGVGHGSEAICAGDKLHCAICDEDGHLATDPNCPEKARRLDKLKARTGRRSRTRARRARPGASKRPPTPSPERLTGEDYPPLPIKNKDCQQEQRRNQGTTPGVPGYFGFFSPSIKRQGRCCEPDLVQAQAAVFVRHDVHHFQIDTAEYCTSFQEVVAVRCRLDKNREAIFASVYLRPETSRRGYNEATPRGRHLEGEAEAGDLVLANDLDYPTRHALHSNQRDSIPDLTWTTAGFVTDWRCDSDPRGSDHYPICITLNVRDRARHARTTKVTDWTRFRLALETTMEEDVPVVDRILGAAKGATTELELTENTPKPDKHLLHLWEDRSKLHTEYLNNGRTHKDLVKVRNKTAQVRRHVKQLSRGRSLDHCASFDERTGLHKLWHTFTAMSGRAKTRNITGDSLLGLQCTQEEFESQAATTFFPQPPTEHPFTMGELVAALENVNVHSVPGKHGVTVRQKAGCASWACLSTRREVLLGLVWKRFVRLIKRISHRFGGACTQVARKLVTSVLTSRACYGATCFYLTEAQRAKLERLYRKALRVVTGLPRHTRVEELYRYAELPTLDSIIQDRKKGAVERRELTQQGRRLLDYDGQTSPAVDIPPRLAPREDVLVLASKPVPRKTSKSRHNRQRQTVTDNDKPSDDPYEITGYTDASWNPETRRAALAVTDLHYPPQTLHLRYETDPSVAELETLAVYHGIAWAAKLKDGTRKITIYTDSLEALKALSRAPRRGTAAYDGLPRGAQVVIHKARTGAALTGDVLAKWRAYTKKHQDQSPVNDELEEPPADPSPCIVTCSTCDIGARPTTQHLLWNCPGLEPIRAKHRGPTIDSLEARTTPKTDARQTSLSLSEFVREAGITGRI